jgi:hypothetical protein
MIGAYVEDFKDVGRAYDLLTYFPSSFTSRSLVMVFAATLALTFLCSFLGAYAYNTPPSGAITVGTGGKYSTLTAALKDTSSK